VFESEDKKRCVLTMKIFCPCHSGKAYSECCQPYHEGKKSAENAQILMRSRYSAYATENFDYIIQTTHPEGSAYKKDREKWKEDMAAFYRNTDFEDLEIQNFIDGQDKAYVVFIAKLSQKGMDGSFIEKSYFEKKGGQWLYHSGTIVLPNEVAEDAS
jgi:SEC-C motif-containing protein